MHILENNQRLVIQNVTAKQKIRNQVLCLKDLVKTLVQLSWAQRATSECLLGGSSMIMIESAHLDTQSVLSPAISY